MTSAKFYIDHDGNEIFANSYCGAVKSTGYGWYAFRWFDDGEMDVLEKSYVDYKEAYDVAVATFT